MRGKMLLRCLILLMMYVFFVCQKEMCARGDVQHLPLKKSMLLQESQVFGKYYLVLAYQRNYPIAFGKYRFNPGIPHPCITFRYFMSDQWFASFSSQYKFLVDKQTQEEVAIATLTQEGAYLHRIHHPLYLTIGHRIHYLNPTTKGMIPLQKYSELDIEIGVGASIGILYHLSAKRTLEFSINRWRGTKTMKLHAVEANLAIGLELN